MSLWRYLIVKIGRWKFLETATWLKGNRYLQGSKESLNIDEEESSKNAGRRRVSKERKDTRGEKKERKPKEGPGYCLFFFTLLSPSVPRRYRQRSALWKFLAFIIFPLLPNYARSQERRKKNDPKFWIFIYSSTFFVRSKISWQFCYYTPLMSI